MYAADRDPTVYLLYGQCRNHFGSCSPPPPQFKDLIPVDSDLI